MAQKRRRRRRRKPRPANWALRFYAIYIALLAVASVVVLKVLWDKLADYQRSIDKEVESEEYKTRVARAPQQTFMTYFEGIDLDWWTDNYLSENPDTLDGREGVRAYFESMASPDGAKAFKAKSYKDGAPVYRVRLDDEGKVTAEIALAGAGVDWNVASVRVDADAECGGEITVPEGCIVTCNGRELGEEYVTADDEGSFPFDSYRDSLVSPVRWKTYRVDGLLREPQLDYTVPEGMELSESEIDGGPVVLMKDQAVAALTDKAENFLRTYLRMMVSGKNNTDENTSACLSLVKNGSEAYKVISATKSSTSVSMAYTDLRVDMISRDAPIKWADNCCSIDLCYHAYAKYGGAEKDYSGGDMNFRVMFLDSGSGYQICAFSF